MVSLRQKGSVKDVACGLGHTLALLEDGRVYSWGNGGNGRLGVGDRLDRATPTIVEALSPRHHSHRVAALFCGASHSLAIDSRGFGFAWGKNNQGQCGVGTTADLDTPSLVVFTLEAQSENNGPTVEEKPSARYN